MRPNVVGSCVCLWPDFLDTCSGVVALAFLCGAKIGLLYTAPTLVRVRRLAWMLGGFTDISSIPVYGQGLI